AKQLLDDDEYHEADESLAVVAARLREASIASHNHHASIAAQEKLAVLADWARLSAEILERQRKLEQATWARVPDFPFGTKPTFAEKHRFVRFSEEQNLIAEQLDKAIDSFEDRELILGLTEIVAGLGADMRSVRKKLLVTDLDGALEAQ